MQARGPVEYRLTAALFLEVRGDAKVTVTPHYSWRPSLGSAHVPSDIELIAEKMIRVAVENGAIEAK
jgi:hypothetical protein